MSVIKSIHNEMYGHIMDLSILKVVLLSYVYIDTHAIPIGSVQLQFALYLFLYYIIHVM